MKPTGYTEMDPRFEPEDPVRWSNWVTEVRGATHRHDRLCGPAVQGLGSPQRGARGAEVQVLILRHTSNTAVVNLQRFILCIYPILTW